jgi:LmbE family N-acetylglucosaminyl deacetylase
MNEFDLDPNISWLFIFAHPDDELAIAAWIRRLTSNGNRVFIAWLHAVGSRGEEAKKAAELLGVSIESCFFGAFEDGSFIENFEGIRADVLNCINSCNPDRIVCAAYEQGHLDHDCLRLAVDQVCGVLEFPNTPYTPHVAKMNRFER